MKIDKDTVEKVAHLARLKFNDVEKDAMVEGMNKMLSFVDKLNEVDTSNVEPLIYINDAVNVLREDDVEQSITQAQALQNAPKKDSDYIKVPTVIAKQ